MNALEQIDNLIQQGRVAFFTAGASFLNEGRCHATVLFRDGAQKYAQGLGDTTEAALSAAISAGLSGARSSLPVDPTQLRRPAKATSPEPDYPDDLDDLLG